MKVRKETMKAGASGILQLVKWRFLMIAGIGRLPQEGLIPPSLGSMRTIIIGHRMAQDSIKPGERTLLIIQRMGTLDRLGEALLQDIFRDHFIADSTANKLPEGGFVLQKSLHDPARSSLVHP
jgi:hypothetical protein